MSPEWNLYDLRVIRGLNFVKKQSLATPSSEANLWSRCYSTFPYWPTTPPTGGIPKGTYEFSSARIGKSGGAPVICLYVPEQEAIYLVMIYGKSQKEDLTQEEKLALKTAADEIQIVAALAWRRLSRVC